MAHFAELNSNNVVLRIVVGCNQDIANNGGEQSEQAAEYFKTICPLSENGVKWVQTSYNNNFRKRHASVGGTYSEQYNAFINAKDYESFVFDENKLQWIPPVAYPSILIDENNLPIRVIQWDQENVRWIGINNEAIPVKWNNNSTSWLLIS
jgi:urocanate hydratase